MNKKKINVLYFVSILFVILISSCQNKTGKTGNLVWTLGDSYPYENVLTISGDGEMPNYETVPWAKYKDEIKEVVLMGNIETIGDNAFKNCANLSNISS